MNLKKRWLGISPILFIQFALATQTPPLGHHIICSSISQSVRQSHQLIVVLSKDWATHTAQTFRYERDSQGHWSKIGSVMETRIGKNGMGWGKGLHSVEGQDSADFRRNNFRWEGGNQSPAGVFHLGATFGTHRDIEMAELKKSPSQYVPVEQGLRCSDDSSSKFYNQFVYQLGSYQGKPSKDIPTAPAEAIKSSEDMFAAANPLDGKFGAWRPYQLGIYIQQNQPPSPRSPIPGDPVLTLGEIRQDNAKRNRRPAAELAKAEVVESLKSKDPAPYASCIFFHVMDPSGAGTSGCTAMSFDDLKELVQWRQPAKKPLLIQLPRHEWRDLVARCGDLPTEATGD